MFYSESPGRKSGTESEKKNWSEPVGRSRFCWDECPPRWSLGPSLWPPRGVWTRPAWRFWFSSSSSGSARAAGPEGPPWHPERGCFLSWTWSWSWSPKEVWWSCWSSRKRRKNRAVDVLRQLKDTVDKCPWRCPLPVDLSLKGSDVHFLWTFKVKRDKVFLFCFLWICFKCSFKDAEIIKSEILYRIISFIYFLLYDIYFKPPAVRGSQWSSGPHDDCKSIKGFFHATLGIILFLFGHFSGTYILLMWSYFTIYMLFLPVVWIIKYFWMSFILI